MATRWRCPPGRAEGEVAGPSAQAQLLGESQCSAATLPRRTSGEEGGEFDVLLGGELVEEMGCLETNPVCQDRSRAKARSES
jgi:hypothetical protein